jgi:hypothetical protein
MTESASERALASELGLRVDQLVRMLDYCALRRKVERDWLVEATLQFVRSGVSEETYAGLCSAAEDHGLDPDEFVAANVVFAAAHWIEQQKRTQ